MALRLPSSSRGLRGRQTRTVFLAFGIPRDHARVDPVEMGSPGQEWLSERRIVDIGGGEEKEERQAGPTAEERMDPIAAQERARMLSRSVTDGRIGIIALPGQDGSTVNDEITSLDQAGAQGHEHGEHKEGFGQRCTCPSCSLPLLRCTRHPCLALYWLLGPSVPKTALKSPVFGTDGPSSQVRGGVASRSLARCARRLW